MAGPAVFDRLVQPEQRLILLFTPPFDQTQHDPGYIKGYPPGVRENGGQYTHAAIWTTWAFAELGDGAQTAQLLKLLNPIYHADLPEKADCYRVEPYVLCADVYSGRELIGRGGWTWYTGSAAWSDPSGTGGRSLAFAKSETSFILNRSSHLTGRILSSITVLAGRFITFG